MTTMKKDRKESGNVPNLRFPEFEGEWKWYKLEDIASLSKGSGISKDQLSEKGQSCILYGELYTKYKSEVIHKILSCTSIDSTNLVKSKTNDVIIPSSGESAIDIATARCVSVSDVLLGGDLNIIRLKKDNGSFLSYQLNEVRKFDIAKVAQGVSVVHLYGESLKKLIVAICSDEEQSKIAKFHSLLDERITTQSKIIEKLESLIKGITQHFLKGKQINVRLKDCVNCYSSSLTENEFEGSKGEYPVYGATGTIAYSSQYDVGEDSILIIKDGASVGRVQYVTGKYSTIGTLNHLTAKSGFSLRYIYYLLRLFNFDKYKVGSGIPHIYFKDYGNELIYCPPTKGQYKIAKTISLVEEKFDIECLLLKNYSWQKQYLLNNMFI
jgi:type I restriction enzyme S subunit